MRAVGDVSFRSVTSNIIQPYRQSGVAGADGVVDVTNFHSDVSEYNDTAVDV